MNETIAAIATPAGEGGVCIIRISGNLSPAIVAGLFRRADGSPVREFIPQKVYVGEVRDAEEGEAIDEVLLTFFKAPRSYTGEDVLEISGHGGVFVASRILRLVLDQGARLAQPGEFTRRAFLNGRIDLSQAEAVADLISAASDKALKSAVSHLKGNLSKILNSMYERLLGVTAQLEASIDFSEEGLKFQKREENLEIARRVKTELEKLISTYRQGKIYREGLKVAIVGKPNVGKSSLLNTLLQEDRAIVTPLPGTTRDTLEERARIRDIHINIVDSAGLRENPEIIEEEGIQRTRTALEQADLTLVLFDRSLPFDKNDDLLIQEVLDKPKLVLFNKSDLPEKLETGKIDSMACVGEAIHISVKTLEGVDQLKDQIYRFAGQGDRTHESVLVTRERHREKLVQSRDSLSRACESLENDLSEEFVAVDINLAMEQLGAILGKTFEEDLLDQIFNTFCIGK